MTDVDPRPDDEIVSAHLDGEATAEEAARVQADPEAQARLAAFDAVRAEVGRTVQPNPSAREAALAAALDVFDREVAPHAEAVTRPTFVPPLPPPGLTWAEQQALESRTELLAPAPLTGPTTAPVVDLAARRSRRGLQVLSAAAMILLVVGVLSAVRLGQRSDTEVANLAAPTAANQSTTQSDNVVAATSESGGNPSAGQATPSTSTTRTLETAAVPGTVGAPATTTAPPTAVTTSPDSSTKSSQVFDLGAFTSRDEVVRAVAAAMSENQSSTTPSPGGAGNGEDATADAATCDATLRATDFEIGALAFTATLTYAGTPAIAFVYAIDQTQHPAANGPARLYIVGRTADCKVLDAETL